jgi:hypothetical protein
MDPRQLGVSHVVHQQEVKVRNREVRRRMDGNPHLQQQQQQRELRSVATGFARYFFVRMTIRIGNLMTGLRCLIPSSSQHLLTILRLLLAYLTNGQGNGSRYSEKGKWQQVKKSFNIHVCQQICISLRSSITENPG